MNCHNHPDKEAIATCSLCGIDICEECNVEIAGNSYCKECVNKIVTQGIMEKSNQEIETPEPVNVEPNIPETVSPEAETITPINEKEIIEEIPESQILQKEKSPENFQTDYEYETEYVETYDESGEEDKYYENPEIIPEPEPEKYRQASEPIIINPVNEKPVTPEQTENQGYGNEQQPRYIPHQEVQKNQVYSTGEYDTVENYQPNPAYAVQEPTAPSNELEAKYERYLDDLYYDENDEYYQEQNLRQQAKAQYINTQDYPGDYQGQYPNERGIREQYRTQQPPNSYQNYDEEYIVPAHSGNREKPTESYEELKKRIERNQYEEKENKKLFRRSKKNKKSKDLENLDIDNIQEMHKIKPKNSDRITATEIVLTIILILLIILVVLYVIYLFTLSGTYLSFFDAMIGLFQDPQLFISNILD